MVRALWCHAPFWNGRKQLFTRIKILEITKALICGKENLSFKKGIWCLAYVLIFLRLCLGHAWQQIHSVISGFPKSSRDYVEFLLHRVYKANGTFPNAGLCFHISAVYRYWNAHLYFRKKNYHNILQKLNKWSFEAKACSSKAKPPIGEQKI